MESKKYLEIAQRKKKEQQSRIPKEWLLRSPVPSGTINLLDIPRTCGVLTDRELEITGNHDATSLVAQLACGALKSEEVVTAFCKRAAVAHQISNCLTEMFFDRALTRARELDAYYAQHGKPMGPLHGLPISMKDCFQIPGTDASIGYAAYAFQPSTITSTFAQILLNAGAVLYCKTNIPQGMIQLDCHNNLFGRCLNPRNTLTTVGGSSGGEGGLLALRGSPLGIGTDIGGSIRIPAMANGLYSIKPSGQRTPYQDQRSPTTPGAHTMLLAASAGPLAHSLRDCEMLLRVVQDAEPWTMDPFCVPGCWDELDTSSLSLPHSLSIRRKLTIGIAYTDGLITPHPPMTTFIHRVATALQTSPYIPANIDLSVVDLDITPIWSQCQSVCNALIGADGSENMYRILESTGEPFSPWLATRMRRRGGLPAATIREVHAMRNKLRRDLLATWAGVDAIICPVAPHFTPRIDSWNGVSYTSTWVLLDCPAATLPVAPLPAADVKGEYAASQKVLGSWDKANRALWEKEDRNIYKDSWACVQIVVPTLEEKRLVKVMEVVDAGVQGLREEMVNAASVVGQVKL